VRRSPGLALGVLAGLPLLISIISAKGNAPLFAVMAALAAALHLWPARRLPACPRPLALGLAAFCLWALASAAWAFDPRADFIGGLRLAAMLGAGLLGVSAAGGLGDGEASHFRRAFLLLYVLGLGVILADQISGNALMGAYTRLKDQVEIPEGFSFQPFIKHRAVVAAIGLWPALLAARQEFGTRSALALALAALGLIASHQSEAALGAVVLGGLVFVLSWRLPRPAFLGGALALALLFALPPFLHGHVPTPREIARAHPGLSPSLLHRLLIWDYALGRIAERPVLGFGFDAAREIGGREEKRHFDFDPEPGRPLYRPFFEPIPLHTHNGVIQLWLELGGVGAALGLGLLLLVWRRCLAETDPWRRGAQSAFFAAVMMPVLLSYGLFQAWWVGTVWLLTASLQAGRRP
jgi:O-antigen ligase